MYEGDGKSLNKIDSQNNKLYVCDVEFSDKSIHINDTITLKFVDGWLEHEWHTEYNWLGKQIITPNYKGYQIILKCDSLSFKTCCGNFWELNDTKKTMYPKRVAGFYGSNGNILIKTYDRFPPKIDTLGIYLYNDTTHTFNNYPVSKFVIKLK